MVIPTKAWKPPGAYPIKLFLHNLWPFSHKLQNFCNLWANLRSKFGCNYKSVIYGSVKFYGIGPSCTVILSPNWWVFSCCICFCSFQAISFLPSTYTTISLKYWGLLKSIHLIIVATMCVVCSIRSGYLVLFAGQWIKPRWLWRQVILPR